MLRCRWYTWMGVGISLGVLVGIHSRLDFLGFDAYNRSLVAGIVAYFLSAVIVWFELRARGAWDASSD